MGNGSKKNGGLPSPPSGNISAPNLSFGGDGGGSNPFQDAWDQITHANHTSGDLVPAAGFRHLLEGGQQDPSKSLAAGVNSQRNNLYGELQQDDSIDRQSKEEIKALAKGGKLDNEGMAAMIKKAREGKGIYAVRKLDQAQRDIMQDMPGRRQLSATYGK